MSVYLRTKLNTENLYYIKEFISLLSNRKRDLLSSELHRIAAFPASTPKLSLLYILRDPEMDDHPSENIMKIKLKESLFRFWTSLRLLDELIQQFWQPDLRDQILRNRPRGQAFGKNLNRTLRSYQTSYILAWILLARSRYRRKYCAFYPSFHDLRVKTDRAIEILHILRDELKMDPRFLVESDFIDSWNEVMQNRLCATELHL